MKRRKKPLTTHPAIRILIIWVIQALALLGLTFFLKGFRVDSLGVALAAAAVIGLLNALVWPLLSYVLFPFAVLTLGLLTLVLNGAIGGLVGTLEVLGTHHRFIDGALTDPPAAERFLAHAANEVDLLTQMTEELLELSNYEELNRALIEKEFDAGTYFVTTAQPLANIAAYLLEPESDDGMLVWNFFDRYLRRQWSRAPQVYPVYKLHGPAKLVTELVTR